MILFSNSFIKNLPTIYLCTPNNELLPKLRGILHIGKSHHHRRYVVEPCRVTAISCLPKTDKAAQYNYQNFIRTMAKIMPKYFDKIRR